MIVTKLNVTNETSFHEAQPGHTYYVSVAAANIIGVGEVRSGVVRGK